MTELDDRRQHAHEARHLLHGIRIGRLAGVEVRIDWSIAVIAWLLTWSLATDALPSVADGYATWIYWVVAAGAALLFLTSLLAHELAHSVVARRHGVEVRDITLWMLGGVSSLESEPRDASTELRIAIAGPATSLALSMIGFVVAGLASSAGLGKLAVAALVWLATINGILAVFNLAPAAPLDGGRILTAVLWQRRRDHASAVVSAARAGRVFAFLLIGLGLAEFAFGAVVGGVWLAFIGWFVYSAAHAEERTVHVRHEMQRARATSGRISPPPLPTSPPSRTRWP